MPRLTITRHWSKDDLVRVSVTADDDHPDGLLGETVRVGVEAYGDALGLTLAAEYIARTETEDPDDGG